MRIYALAVSKMPSICVDAPISHGELPVYEVSFYLDGMQYVRVFALFMVRVRQVSAMPKAAHFFVTESQSRFCGSSGVSRDRHYFPHQRFAIVNIK